MGKDKVAEVQEPPYEIIEQELVEFNCDLSRDSIEATRLACELFINSKHVALKDFLKRVESVPEPDVKAMTTRQSAKYESRETKIAKFLDKIRDDILNKLVANLDDRLCADRESLLSYKGRMLNSLRICREAANQFRRSYDISARHRETVNTRNLVVELKQKVENDTKELCGRVEERDFINTILSDQVDRLTLEKVHLERMLEIANNEIEEQRKFIKAKKRVKSKVGKKGSRFTTINTTSGPSMPSLPTTPAAALNSDVSDSGMDTFNCKRCQVLEYEISQLKAKLSSKPSTAEAKPPMSKVDSTSILQPEVPHELSRSFLSGAKRPDSRDTTTFTSPKKDLEDAKSELAEAFDLTMMPLAHRNVMTPGGAELAAAVELHRLAEEFNDSFRTDVDPLSPMKAAVAPSSQQPSLEMAPSNSPANQAQEAVKRLSPSGGTQVGSPGRPRSPSSGKPFRATIASVSPGGSRASSARRSRTSSGTGKRRSTQSGLISTPPAASPDPETFKGEFKIGEVLEVELVLMGSEGEGMEIALGDENEHDGKAHHHGHGHGHSHHHSHPHLHHDHHHPHHHHHHTQHQGHHPLHRHSPDSTGGQDQEHDSEHHGHHQHHKRHHKRHHRSHENHDGDTGDLVEMCDAETQTGLVEDVEQATNVEFVPDIPKTSSEEGNRTMETLKDKESEDVAASAAELPSGRTEFAISSSSLKELETTTAAFASSSKAALSAKLEVEQSGLVSNPPSHAATRPTTALSVNTDAGTEAQQSAQSPSKLVSITVVKTTGGESVSTTESAESPEIMLSPKRTPSSGRMGSAGKPRSRERSTAQRLSMRERASGGSMMKGTGSKSSRISALPALERPANKTPEKRPVSRGSKQEERSQPLTPSRIVALSKGRRQDDLNLSDDEHDGKGTDDEDERLESEQNHEHKIIEQAVTLPLQSPPTTAGLSSGDRNSKEDCEYRDALLAEAQQIQQELQTRLLSLEFQNSKLSKRLRSEEVNLERIEALHKLQIQERDLLLRVLSEQVMELREKLAHDEAVLKHSSEHKKIVVRDTFAAKLREEISSPLCKKSYPLANVKWDASQPFVESAFSHDAIGSPMPAARSLSPVARGHERLVPTLGTAVLENSTSTVDVKRPSTTAASLSPVRTKHQSPSSVNMGDLLKQHSRSVSSLPIDNSAEAAAPGQQLKTPVKEIPLSSTGTTGSAVLGVDVLTPEREQELRAVRQQIASLIISQSAKTNRGTLRATAKAAEMKMLKRAISLKPL